MRPRVTRSHTTQGAHHEISQVLISSELRAQGLNILQHLIDKRLAFGGPVLNGPAKFLWKSEIVEHDYAFIVTYTREDLKDQLVAEAERVSVEDVCMISFIPFEGNAALIRLLDDAFADRDTLESLQSPRTPWPRSRSSRPMTYLNRTHDSFGDLTTATSDDPTR